MSAAGAARPLLAVFALLLLAGVGLVSAQRARDQLAVIEACSAAEAGDWAGALAGTRDRVDASPTGRAAAECRCLALLASGRGPACVSLLEEILAAPEAASWAPRPDLAVHLIQTRRDAGRTADAAAFARRAARFHPGDPDLFYLELVTRSSVEDEAAVLADLEARLPEGGRVTRMRVSLATRHLQRGDSAGALAVLGAEPSAGATRGELSRWYETRGMAFASAADLAGLRRTYAQWREDGGDSDELRARYALTLSIANLADPEQPLLELLEQGLAVADGLGDPKLREALAIRTILTLVASGEPERALASYDRWRQRFPLAGLTRAELERSAAHRELGNTAPETRRGELRFRIPGSRHGDALRLSPEGQAPVDSEYDLLAVPESGRVFATREVGTAPQRWVYRDGRGRVLASGTAHPVAGGVVEIAVTPRAPRPHAHLDLSRAPADGHRRVALMLLDCADWRIAQYLRARGELPLMNGLIAGGYRAVLDSDPPLTAAALEALVWPRRESGDSVVGLVHRMGLELAGLSSIGDNPFASLAWLMPEERDLFAVLGAGEHAVANLLFAHGGIRAGRHGEISGPGGHRRRVELAKSARDLDAGERARWPELARVDAERDAVHLRTIAAEFDSAVALWKSGDLDLMALRIEPLDILTHAHFAAAVRGGQDDGQGLLFDVYRYIDARLLDLHRHLDADDVLIVMSDHGIRTAMEHSRFALFVAAGGGVPAGRAPGRPSLRGVGRVLADLLGVESDWPDTGVAAWAQPLGRVAAIGGAGAVGDSGGTPAPAAPAPR